MAFCNGLLQWHRQLLTRDSFMQCSCAMDLCESLRQSFHVMALCDCLMRWYCAVSACLVLIALKCFECIVSIGPDTWLDRREDCPRRMCRDRLPLPIPFFNTIGSPRGTVHPTRGFSSTRRVTGSTSICRGLWMRRLHGLHATNFTACIIFKYSGGTKAEPRSRDIKS